MTPARGPATPSHPSRALTGWVRSVDWWVVVALTWILVAVGATAVLGPELGFRGRVWLGLHHVICLAGAGHELVRGWRRRRKGPAPER